MAIPAPEVLCVVAGVGVKLDACKVILQAKNLTAGSLPKCCAELGRLDVIEAVI
ncbi:hypothetical protein FH972_019229 [Carpinus fangiana]|uniref:Hydrophobic seed protein domain-containing protein n=1 Tax=Carpinus fangiana TaxID=176857 RepID=A0A5N6RSH1_9ROSI|nr:hypothetical protein FH972_019229 [Carpinus fangiana]